MSEPVDEIYRVMDLVEKHGLRLFANKDKSWWVALGDTTTLGSGPTIYDAVRSCVRNLPQGLPS